jgi:hypothetical protein
MAQGLSDLRHFCWGNDKILEKHDKKHLCFTVSMIKLDKYNLIGFNNILF